MPNTDAAKGITPKQKKTPKKPPKKKENEGGY